MGDEVQPADPDVIAGLVERVKEALVIRPGDTLIIRLGSTSYDEFERFRQRFDAMKERMPGVEVLVMGNVEQLAVYRPGSAA